MFYIRPKRDRLVWFATPVRSDCAIAERRLLPSAWPHDAVDAQHWVIVLARDQSSINGEALPFFPALPDSGEISRITEHGRRWLAAIQVDIKHALACCMAIRRLRFKQRAAGAWEADAPNTGVADMKAGRGRFAVIRNQRRGRELRRHKREQDDDRRNHSGLISGLFSAPLLRFSRTTTAPANRTIGAR